MERITEQQFKDALNIVKQYEQQLKDDKLSLYDKCTKNDFVILNYKNQYGKMITAYWITKSKELTNRNPDGAIVDEGTFFTIEYSNVTYATFKDAEKALFKSFKRKKLIDNE